jgi:hypothetical protein
MYVIGVEHWTAGASVPLPALTVTLEGAGAVVHPAGLLSLPILNWKSDALSTPGFAKF